MGKEPNDDFPLPVPVTGWQRWRPVLLIVGFVLFFIPLVFTDFVPVPELVGRACVALVVAALLYDSVGRMTRARSTRGQRRRALAKEIPSELGHAEWSGVVDGLDRNSLDSFAEALTEVAPRLTRDHRHSRSSLAVFRWVPESYLHGYGRIVTIRVPAGSGGQDVTVTVDPLVPTAILDFRAAAHDAAEFVLALQCLARLRTGSLPMPVRTGRL